MASLFDQALAGIGAAIDDVREKYEESVWGRVVTDSGIGPAESPDGAGFGSLTTTMEVTGEVGLVPVNESTVGPPEGLSGEILPPEPSPGPQGAGDALRLEGPVMDVEYTPDSFTAQLAAITQSSSANEPQSQSIDL